MSVKRFFLLKYGGLYHVYWGKVAAFLAKLPVVLLRLNYTPLKKQQRSAKTAAAFFFTVFVFNSALCHYFTQIYRKRRETLGTCLLSWGDGFVRRNHEPRFTVTALWLSSLPFRTILTPRISWRMRWSLLHPKRTSLWTSRTHSLQNTRTTRFWVRRTPRR